jgi:hypothetical protein
MKPWNVDVTILETHELNELPAAAQLGDLRSQWAMQAIEHTMHGLKGHEERKKCFFCRGSFANDDHAIAAFGIYICSQKNKWKGLAIPICKHCVFTRAKSELLNELAAKMGSKVKDSERHRLDELKWA